MTYDLQQCGTLHVRPAKAQISLHMLIRAFAEYSMTVKLLTEHHLEFLSLKTERSGSVVECLTGNRGGAGSNFTGATVLWSLSKTHLS